MIIKWKKFNEKINLLKEFPDLKIHFEPPSRSSLKIENPVLSKLRKLEKRMEYLLSEEEQSAFLSKAKNLTTFKSRYIMNKNDVMSFLLDLETLLEDELVGKTFEVIEPFKIKRRIFRVGEKIDIEEFSIASSVSSYYIIRPLRKSKRGFRQRYQIGCYMIIDNLKRNEEEKHKADIKLRTSRFDI